MCSAIRRAAAMLLLTVPVRPVLAAPDGGSALRTGAAALGVWRDDAPGVRRRITEADLPPPFATQSVDNGAALVEQPKGAWPHVPPGFEVERVELKLERPRQIHVAPSGDVFIAESSAGRVRAVRLKPGTATVERNDVFASGLDRPFGIAFYPPGPAPRFVYVAETGRVRRFPYHAGDLRARGKPEVIVGNIPSGGLLRGGGHWTRDIVFSLDGRRMFVSVGSRSNDDEDGPKAEERRADVLVFKPDGSGEQLYASGLRNAVGLAVHPRTGELYASVNERDGLGDDLVPDYVTRVKEGGFYGWPFYYLGDHEDPHFRGARPDLKGKVTPPDVLIASHSASLGMTFYDGAQFPKEYAGDAFAAEHGSWNRSRRTGYKVIRIPMRNGKPTGEYEDFMTGFVRDDGAVWGRPVGVAVAEDGSLLVTDDGAGRLWRVSYRRPGG